MLENGKKGKKEEKMKEKKGRENERGKKKEKMKKKKRRQN